jgi:hypothetical protein
MAPKLRATPPPFEARPKKVAKKVREDPPAAVPTRAQKARKTPPAPPVTIRVTAGPFQDDNAPHAYQSWTVITRAGDVVTHHRFRTKEDASAFAAGIK